MAEKTVTKEKELQVLHRVAGYISGELGLVELLHKIVEVAGEVTAADSCFIYVYEEKTSVYRDAYGKLRDSRLKPKKTYFMYFPEEEQFRKVQDKRRWFVRLFPENKREVRRMFRRNNLRRFDEKEMVRAFQLLDEAGFFD